MTAFSGVDKTVFTDVQYEEMKDELRASFTYLPNDGNPVLRGTFTLDGKQQLLIVPGIQFKAEELGEWIPRITKAFDGEDDMGPIFDVQPACTGYDSLVGPNTVFAEFWYMFGDEEHDLAWFDEWQAK